MKHHFRKMNYERLKGRAFWSLRNTVPKNIIMAQKLLLKCVMETVVLCLLTLTPKLETAVVIDQL